MANMGAQRLILIQPACEINLEARQGAAGAQTHLLEQTTYSSWDEFFQKEPEGIRVAFCAKHKKETDDLGFSARLENLRRDLYIPRLPLQLIFGPEDHGLSNDDVKYANFICQLPIYGPFTSLNLSHAVLLALYMVREGEMKGAFHDPGQATRVAELSRGPAASAGAIDDIVSPQPQPGAAGDFQFPEAAIEKWLHTLGFATGERRTDVYQVLKRILLRNLASAKELRILEAIVNQTIRKLPKNGEE
jgi:tRNA/rRNA methyltransferase